MYALTRLGPKAARSTSLLYSSQPRHMASASASMDPVQKLFVDKVREFKNTNQTADVAYNKALADEMERLKRVYQVEDTNKLTQLDYKFKSEVEVSLHDLDEKREFREQLVSGEYQKKLAAESKEPSILLASIPEQTHGEFELPQMNKPNPELIRDNQGVPRPIHIAGTKPDYTYTGGKMTPEQLERNMLVRFGPSMPTINDDKAPGRDAVNFPRIPIRDQQPPTRYHFVPESWFQFFYPKTGVTGPYVFAGAFTTFLMSKEWLITSPDLSTAISTTLIFALGISKYGPAVNKWAVGLVEKRIADWEHWRTGNIAMLNSMQVHYKEEVNKGNLIDDVYQIREMDVEMQLEKEHRNRLKTVYEDTKRRLNYLVAVADSQRQIAHQSMVNWVISNAVSSIGQKQEAEVLDNCVVNLRQLASKNANVI